MKRIEAAIGHKFRQNASIAEEADAFDSVEHQVGGECFKRVGHANSCAQQVAASGPVW
jgi:hypothetical protein